MILMDSWFYIDEHPALTTSNFEMNALASGTDEIVDDSGIAISSSPSVDVTFATYTNQSIEYSKISSYISDVRYQLETQSLSISENNQEKLILNLSCSSSGSTKISYSIASYNGVDIPSFVSVDSSTGILNIEAPSVSSSTEYSFYINSSISGATNYIQKIVKLTVNKWTSSNCQKWKSNDSSIWSVWDSEYVLSSGLCSAASQTSKSLTTTTQVLYGTTVGAVLFLSFLNASSVASLWSMINQAQIFFLLLLTGAYIPADIKLIIIGMKIWLNPYYYFQSSKGDSSNIVENYFNFGLEDVRLESLGIKSDSTAVNIYSFIISILVIMSIHLWLLLIQCWWKKWCKEENQSWALKVTKWTLSKLSLLFEFALYIRIILKINQYLLISSISEIYHFNYSNIKRIISLIISLFVFILWLCIILFVLIFVFLKEDITKNRNKFAQLFNGINKQKTFKFYITALLIRRIILVLILITIVPDSSTAAIIICFIIQFICMLYVIFLRPYSEIKSNIIEAVNEIYFIVMLGSLFYYNSESRWSSTPTSAYTWVMTSNSFSSFTIIIGKYYLWS